MNTGACESRSDEDFGAFDRINLMLNWDRWIKDGGP